MSETQTIEKELRGKKAEAQETKAASKHERVISREQISKESVLRDAPSTKVAFTFKIPVKSIEPQKMSELSPPCLSHRVPSFIKPKLISTKVQPTNVIELRISIMPAITTITDLRIPTS